MKDTQLTDLAVNTEADALGKLLDDGYVDILDGAKAETGDTPLSGQQLLVRLGFGAPAFRSSVGGILASNPLKSAVAQGTGKPTWFRAYTPGGNPVFDGSAGRGSNFNMQLPADMIVEGMTVGCSGITHSIVKSMAGI